MFGLCVFLDLAKSRGSTDFEVVAADGSIGGSIDYPVRIDSRRYDSEEEDFDTTDRLQTLALGTFMLRNARKKALVDASYNRFAWNDPMGLPNWFLDDETRHNKPQLPVPHALVDQIKNKYQLTGTKVIKKVAEARARKKKRAVQKLNAAKKQASVMAENSELSERQKVKAISKAVRNSKAEKSSKVYVATRKTKSGSSGTAAKGGGKGGKLKFVDSRMKKDRRAMKVKEKKRRK
jgi:AdoMet-dependent rRNA methyltransferase SPB1